MIDINKYNLDNIETEYNLFGEKINKLSVKDRIGFLPTSIWRPNWQETTRLKRIIGDFGETRLLEQSSSCTKAFGNKETDARIFDPLAGGGTRAIIAAAMGHDYYGVELRQNEVDRIMKMGKDLKLDFCIIEGDGQTEDFDHEDWFDFSYTCPPYYNLEIYSHLKDDLSNASSYKVFLRMLGNCLVNTYNVLKPGALSVWVVGNLRNKNGNLLHLNGHTALLGQRAGFKLHDEIIFEGASDVAKLRSGAFAANRKSVRIHEYILIFKK